MTIGLMDITDITIYGLRRQLCKLHDKQEQKVIFTDEDYTLVLTSAGGRIIKNDTHEEMYMSAYNLVNMTDAVCKITALICSLIEKKYK